jgi:hypothetical protein
VKGLKEKVDQFDVSGTIDKKDAMARTIVEKVQEYLSQ